MSEERRRKDREYYHKTKDRRNELARQHYHNNKESHYHHTRKSLIKKQFGITMEQYQRMLEDQDYTCLICNGEDKNRNLAIDHNHETGQVRGLLCGNCNRALGLFKDSQKLLEKAAEYLRAHGGSNSL